MRMFDVKTGFLLNSFGPFTQDVYSSIAGQFWCLNDPVNIPGVWILDNIFALYSAFNYESVKHTE